MPGMSGIEFQEWFATSRVRLPIIFITSHGDIPMSVRAMKAGAIEFLTKPFREQDLLDAIHEALRRDSTRWQTERQTGQLIQRYHSLSEREKQIMALVVSGLLNKQIAGKLNVSKITVKVRRGTALAHPRSI
jgi:FixJ family two-component response regulator